jgi:hypothetical protein
MEARSVVEVVEYDEAWPVRAAAARADLISPGAAPGAGLGRMSYRADQPPSSRYEEPLANDAGAEQR